MNKGCDTPDIKLLTCLDRSRGRGHGSRGRGVHGGRGQGREERRGPGHGAGRAGLRDEPPLASATTDAHWEKEGFIFFMKLQFDLSRNF